jgi:hypothetical protein
VDGDHHLDAYVIGPGSVLNDLAAGTDPPRPRSPARVVDRPDLWHDDMLPGALWMHGTSSEYGIDPVDEYVIGLPTGRAGYDLRRRSTSRRVHIGEMVVLDPEHSHAGTPTPAGPWTARLLVLPMALVRSTGDDMELPALLRSGFDDPVVDSPALRTRFLALHEASRTGAPRLERECVLLALLDDLTLCTRASARPAGDPGVARALSASETAGDHLSTSTPWPQKRAPPSSGRCDASVPRSASPRTASWSASGSRTPGACSPPGRRSAWPPPRPASPTRAISAATSGTGSGAHPPATAASSSGRSDR